MVGGNIAGEKRHERFHRSRLVDPSQGTVRKICRMPAASLMEKAAVPSSCSLRGLDWLNFFLADVQTGVGPFLAIYLAAYNWNEQSIGLVLTLGGIAGIITQTPLGELIDRLHAKRMLIGLGVLALAMGALITALFPGFWPVAFAQMLIGGTSSIFLPAIAAISLGLVGHKWFDRRQGRNQTFNAAGNVAAAIAMGLIGYFFSNRGIFFFVAVFAAPTIASLLLIRPGEINHELARGYKPGGKQEKPVRARELLRDKPLVIFLICAVMFHFANAAILPLLGEMLAKGQGRSSMMFMSACVVTTQFTITLIAAQVGRLAGSWGRKPLLLTGFAVLPVRAVLYTLTNSPALLIAIQVLDGVAAGIFGVVSALVIADLTRGTGRFNLTQGAIATAVAIGAALSQLAAGTIVHQVSYRAGFLFCAAIAAAAFVILLLFVPETNSKDDDSGTA